MLTSRCTQDAQKNILILKPCKPGLQQDNLVYISGSDLPRELISISIYRRLVALKDDCRTETSEASVQLDR